MLTPDQIRIRLEHVTGAHSDPSDQVRCLRDLLEEVLPELVASVRQQPRMGMKTSGEMLAEVREEERPAKPRPWYRRAWDRIDRYLPRVRVSIGPRDSWGRFEDRW